MSDAVHQPPVATPGRFQLDRATAERLTGGRWIGATSAVELRGACLDNRAVRPGCLFACIIGARVDGHDFAPAAVPTLQNPGALERAILEATLRTTGGDLREKLSAADRAVLEENRGKHRAQFKQARQAVEVARAEVYAASHAEPFDQAALDAALAAESKAKAAMLSLIREKKASIMRRLSPEGQAVFKAVGEKYGDRLKDRSGDKRP